MKPQKGYYSVIQYCPDLSRFESANIGVILFCPESGFLKAMTSNSNQRIQKFFGRAGHDWKQIQAFKKGIEDRLKKEHTGIRTIDDLHQFIAMRANSIQVSDPRPMRVVDPEHELTELFNKMVGESSKRESPRSLKKELANKFSLAGLDRKIVADVTVEVPVVNRDVEIPFGFQNGRFNLIQPVRFGASDPDTTIRTACKYAVEGRSIFEHEDARYGELQLLIVGQFRSNDEQSASVVRRVFNDNKVKLYQFDKVPQLIDEIRRTGKDISDLPLAH